MKKTKIFFNKPTYLGMSILDLSKTLTFIFTDTDSLAYEIETEDFYKDIKDDVEAKFDTSNFPKTIF